MLCGREADIRTIADNCRAGRFTVLTSEPGLGASSLLRAGVAPALQRAGYITVVHSAWQGRYFAERLRDAIATAVHEQADGAFVPDLDALRDFLGRAHRKTGRTVAILLDQFEDYLQIQAETDIANDFDAELSDAVSSRAGCFIIGLHPDAIPALERLNQHIPNLMGNRMALGPISTEAGKELVRKAAARADMKIEAEAVDQIVAAPPAAVEGGVHPLFAAVGAACLLEAESNLKSRVARAATLTANGGAGRLILGSIDPVIDELGTNHAELLLRWIPFLLSPDGRRLVAREEALVAHAGKWNRFAVTLLPLLLKKDILRALEMPAGLRYEIARQSTATVVNDWWVRAEATIAARQRALFRIRSISIAAGAIILAYLIYLFFSVKQT